MVRIALLLVVALAAAGYDPAAAADRPPNILFVLTDDQGWTTLGCYGGKLVPTPNLDRLAAGGVRFTAAYVTPQCTPTRATLLTGQYPSRHRMWHVIPWYGLPWAPVEEPAYVESLPRETFTLPKGLKAAGYATGCFGKWHLTHGPDGNYTSLTPSGAPHFGFDVIAEPRPKAEEERDKAVDFLTNHAIRFIEAQREKPWFCLLTHHTIHGKVFAPADLNAKYLKNGAPTDGLHNATYLAAIEHLDTSVGRLLASLEKTGQDKNTIVVFLSDNGGVYQARSKDPSAASGPPRLAVDREEYSNAPLRAGKGSAYEGGIRVPMIVRWPGHADAGRAVDTPVHAVDLLPTLFAAAGGSAPPGHVLDGVNLSPLLKAGGSIAPRPLFFYMPLYDLRWAATPCAVVRDGDLKLIEYFGDSFDADGVYHPGAKLELFDLKQDIGETRDLSKSRPEDVARLRALLHEHFKSTGAAVPGKNPRHDPARQFEETRVKP